MARYKVELRPQKVMSHRSELGSGKVVWQAQQTLIAWSKKHASEPQTVLLRSLLTAAKLAQELTTDKIRKLSRDKREKLLKFFMEQPGGFEFPPPVQSSLVTMAVKEAKLESKDGLASALNILLPLQATASFHCLKPTLAQSELSDQQTSVVLSSCMTELFCAPDSGRDGQEGSHSCIR